MKNTGENDLSGVNNSGLLSLALDCSEMVDKLSRGLKLESQGNHQSALEELDLVKNEIDSWLDRLDDVESRELEKERVVRGLEEARRAVDLDSVD